VQNSSFTIKSNQIKSNQFYFECNSYTTGASLPSWKVSEQALRGAFL
jgi:hypothetical protein